MSRSYFSGPGPLKCSEASSWDLDHLNAQKLVSQDQDHLNVAEASSQDLVSDHLNVQKLVLRTRTT